MEVAAKVGEIGRVRKSDNVGKTDKASTAASDKVNNTNTKGKLDKPVSTL